MKNNLLGEKILSGSFYLYRFRKYVSYGFPIINLCNPGVHYETSCIIMQFNDLLIYILCAPQRFCSLIRFNTKIILYASIFYW